tara:strand:+ start:191 stop:451 length:261 start_codon:yes stop_codon:yes gene_type:complete
VSEFGIITPLDDSIIEAKNFITGLIIDLSFRKVLITIEELRKLEDDAYITGATAAAEQYQATRHFFENNISELLIDKPSSGSYPEA